MEIFELITNGGPMLVTLIIAFFWKQERDERVKAQEWVQNLIRERDDAQENSVKLVTELAADARREHQRQQELLVSLVSRKKDSA